MSQAVANDFETAVDLVLSHEGGYTPGLAGDPGGETNWGISARSHPGLDIQHLTRADAVAIYKDNYWTDVMANAPTQQVANCALDCAVNQGPSVCRLLYDNDLRLFQLRRLLHYATGNPKFFHSWFERTLDVG